MGGSPRRVPVVWHHASRGSFFSILAPWVDFGEAGQEAQGRWSVPAGFVMVLGIGGLS